MVLTPGAATGSAKAADRASLTVVPVTATVWAASHRWPEGSAGSDSGSGRGGGARKAASAAASAGTLPVGGFDLVLSFNTDDAAVMRSVLYGVDGGEEEGGGGSSGDGQARRLAATAALRNHMGRVFAGDQQQVASRGGFSSEAVQLLQVSGQGRSDIGDASAVQGCRWG